MRVAYADPPYPLQSQRLYGDHPDYAGEVDHAELCARLAEYGAWALSTSASALGLVLPLCPLPRVVKGRHVDGARVLVWEKPQPVPRPVAIQFAWEPIVVYGGRDRAGRSPIRDVIRANPRDGRMHTPGFPGAKPRPVLNYIFEALGLEPDDDLDDLYPGSGAVGRAWEDYRTQGVLA